MSASEPEFSALETTPYKIYVVKENLANECYGQDS